jgi:hypothetical protein
VSVSLPLQLAGVVFYSLALVAQAAQPVQFPHNTHVKLGLACIDCHTGADVYAAAGIPSVTKCMLCHAKLATNKPEVQKVIQYAKTNEEIPWQRVYEFSNEAHVKFRHAPHYEAKIACATCHGDLTKETVATLAVTFTMGKCLTCHRERNAPQDCAACHY